MCLFFQDNTYVKEEKEPVFKLKKYDDDQLTKTIIIVITEAMLGFVKINNYFSD